MPSKRIVRPFDSHGCLTQFHNALLDSVMPNVSPNAWKILCLIIRQTVGWQREDAGISYGTIQRATGIGSRTTVSAALKELQELQLIERGRDDEQVEMSYRLNRSAEVEWQPQISAASPVQKMNIPQSRKWTRPSSKNGLPPSPENGLHIRKETKNTWKQGETREGLDLTGQQKPATRTLKAAPFFEPDPAEKQVETYTAVEKAILSACGMEKPRSWKQADTLAIQAATLKAERVTPEEIGAIVAAKPGRVLPLAFFAERLLAERAATRRGTVAPYVQHAPRSACKANGGCDGSGWITYPDERGIEKCVCYA